MLQNNVINKKVIIFFTVGVIALLCWFKVTISPASPVAFVNEVFFVEDNRLFTLTNKKTEEILLPEPDISIGILHVNHNSGEILLASINSTDTQKSGGLWLIEKGGIVTKISSERPIDASFSPDGELIAFVSDETEELSLLNRQGKVVKIIPGKTWGTVVWSYDGTKLAYTKLSEPPCQVGADLINSDFCKVGIVVFDLTNDTEEMVTNNGNDDGPVAFSKDDSKLYINSGRPYDDQPEAHIMSTWLVDLETKQTKRLTNQLSQVESFSDFVPTIDKSESLWLFDGSAVFSSRTREEGVWKFSFSKTGEIEEVEKISEGTSPRWLEKNKSIIVLTNKDNQSVWKKLY